MSHDFSKAFVKINGWDNAEATKKFFHCCSSQHWSELFAMKRPFQNFEEMCQQADQVWFSLGKADWLEAFGHHPRIGANIDALRVKYQPTKSWSSQEQSGITQASEETLKSLQQQNIDYEKKFGHVFLICATGKSADEMLQALKARINNSPEIELKNASVEQSKIAHLRLKKLLEENQ
jgi:2-oxo-4-hydroxy-4-carboxy-5-ureidoimidazoline decarboxylase